jgi:MoaA/NifB/PqqE/SkfB family radical SAM enzyme
LSQIRIVSWLLTRKCNLRCKYCAIVSNYTGKPPGYPDMAHYLKNEMSSADVIDCLRRMKIHNPDMFHILYGGEPLLKTDLADIVNYCNKENIHYTIITNNSEEVQPLLQKLLKDVDYISGLTSSVDPSFFLPSIDDDSKKKSLEGFKRLVELKKIVKDPVAEITVVKDTIPYLYKLVKELTKEGINSDITFVDIAKSVYYDFSNVTDPYSLVYSSVELAEQLDRIYHEKLNVHLDIHFIQKVWDILPSDLDCEIEKGVHNLTVDADGTIRLCLRIRGIETPKRLNIHNFMNEDGLLNRDLFRTLESDKKIYCQKCNWTCQIMSRMIDDNEKIQDSLIHKDKRSGGTIDG